MLRYFFFFLPLSLMPLAFSIESLACSCAPFPIRPDVTIEQRRKEQRDYFLNQFKGAAFIGKIVKRELVRIDRNVKTDGDEANQYDHYYRYTIRVREHWFGVNSRSIFVYGEPEKYPIYEGVVWGSTSCGFKLKSGRIYFFTPELYNGNLHIGQCDFAEAGSDPSDYPAAEFRKIMGESKRF